MILIAWFDLSSANALNLVESKNLSFGKRVKEALTLLFKHNNPYHYKLTHPTFKKIVGKAKNADNQHFLLFQLCFLHCHRQK